MFTNKCCKGCGKKGTLVHCWWECKLVQPTVRRFHKKLKIELLYDPAILLLGISLKETKTLIWKDTCTPVFIAALFTIAKTWKQSPCDFNLLLISFIVRLVEHLFMYLRVFYTLKKLIVRSQLQYSSLTSYPHRRGLSSLPKKLSQIIPFALPATI